MVYIYKAALTLALEALLDQSIQHGATVVTEGGTFVIVNLKPMWHIDVEPRLSQLQIK